MREFAVIFIAARPKPSMAKQTKPSPAILYPLLILVGFGVGRDGDAWTTENLT